MPFRFFITVFLLSLVTATAHAQAVTQLNQLTFGRLVVPNGGGTVQIDADNTVSIGSNLIISPPSPSRGRYRIQGGGNGTIDIAVTNVNTCDAGFTMDAFPADWRNTDYPDIYNSPIVGAPYNGNSVLRLGARISYSGTVAIGACPTSFDIEFTIY